MIVVAVVTYVLPKECLSWPLAYIVLQFCAFLFLLRQGLQELLKNDPAVT